LNNVIQAMKMLIAAIRFFRADDIRPYNDRNSFSVCSCFCRKIAISDFPEIGTGSPCKNAQIRL
ncbi:MAG: hypothetical protein IJI53_03595, partial [Clostridia bacterium]|nr:hypothetical protein [Clostridia bacterium]